MNMPAPDSILVILPKHLQGTNLQGKPVEFTFEENDTIYKGMFSQSDMLHGNWHFSIAYSRPVAGRLQPIVLPLPQSTVDGIQLCSETNPTAKATLPKELDRLPVS